jgi:hypothetical protein
MRRAQQQVLAFLCLNSSGTPVTGLNFANGEVSLSKDAAAFVALAGARVTEIGLGWYCVTLTTAEANAGFLILAVRKSGVSAYGDVSGTTTGETSAAVVDNVANTATTFVTSLTESGNYWAGAGIAFTSGALRGQVREVASYDGATNAVTLAIALTAEPADGDVFVIINR